MVSMCKSRIVDTGMPERVITLYLEDEEQQLITRMKGIIKKTLKASATSDTRPQSKSIETEGEPLPNVQMKYASKKTPKERRRDAVKKKIEHDFVMSTSSSDESVSSVQEQPKAKKSKRASDAHEAHKQMCQKAMDTMDGVNALLAKVQERMDKNP